MQRGIRQKEEGKARCILLHIGFRRGSAPAPLASAPTTAIPSVRCHVKKSASAPDIIGAQTERAPCLAAFIGSGKACAIQRQSL